MYTYREELLYMVYKPVKQLLQWYPFTQDLNMYLQYIDVENSWTNNQGNYSKYNPDIDFHLNKNKKAWFK